MGLAALTQAMVSRTSFSSGSAWPSDLLTHLGGFAVVLALAAGLAMRAWIRRPCRLGSVPTLSREQLASLARGNTGLLEMVLAEMVWNGHLNVNREQGTLVMASSHAAQTDWSTTERLVLEHLHQAGTLNKLYDELARFQNSPHALTKETMRFMIS